MPLLRIRLSAGMVAVALVAVDLAALRYATAPWDSGKPLYQPLLNLLPMINALVIMGYRLGDSRDQSRDFAVGFLIGGSIALLLHAAHDWVNPQPMWTCCDWLANHCPNPFGKTGNRALTYVVPGRGSFFRLYPAFALLISVPEFAVAWASEMGWRKWSMNRHRRLTTIGVSAADIEPAIGSSQPGFCRIAESSVDSVVSTRTVKAAGRRDQSQDWFRDRCVGTVRISRSRRACSILERVRPLVGPLDATVRGRSRRRRLNLTGSRRIANASGGGDFANRQIWRVPSFWRSYSGGRVDGKCARRCRMDGPRTERKVFPGV